MGTILSFLSAVTRDYRIQSPGLFFLRRGDSGISVQNVGRRSQPGNIPRDWLMAFELNIDRSEPPPPSNI